MNGEALAKKVREYFAAWQSGNRAFLEEGLADDFTFTSPYDDHIDRKAYFEKCWPNHGSIKALDLRVMADGNEAFILYDLTPRSGPMFRNVEHHVFEGDRLKSVEVFFGDPPSFVGKADYQAFLGAAMDAWKKKAFAVPMQSIPHWHASARAPSR